MATETIYGVTADAVVRSSDSVYATARAGTGTLALEGTASSTDLYCGQDYYTASGLRRIWQSFIGFDLDAFWTANPTAVVSAATLKIYVEAIGAGVGGKTLEARLFDWGVAVATTDFVPGADLSGDALLASYANDASTGLKTWTNDTLLTNLPSSGVYRMVLCPADQTNNVAPAANSDELMNLSAADHATQANRPQLILTYTIPAPSTGAALLACTF